MGVPAEAAGGTVLYKAVRGHRVQDGRIAWRMKRPLPDGSTHLFFTGLELLRRLASLVPPPRANLTRFHGVFAPGAKVRPFLLPQAWAEPEPEEESPFVAATVEQPQKERTPPWVGSRAGAEVYRQLLAVSAVSGFVLV